MLQADLLKRYPVLFHMTNGSAWPSIKNYGLLSPKAIYERLNFPPEEIRRQIRLHRPEKVPLGGFVLRDQRPLRPHNLAHNLKGSDLNPEDWHESLNERVFFSTKAKFVAELRESYLTDAATVILIDTAKLLQRHRETIELTKFNSGAARMPSHKKNRADFQAVGTFPFANTFKPKELTVLHSVPEIEPLLIEVVHLPPHTPFAWR